MPRGPEVKSKNNLNCSVLYCVLELCIIICTVAHTCEQFLNLHVGLGLDFVLCLFRFTIYVFLLSIHADRQSVEISVTVCLFFVVVMLSFCTVIDFFGQDKKASGIKFCTVVQGCPGQGISHFEELCSPRSPKSD